MLRFTWFMLKLYLIILGPLFFVMWLTYDPVYEAQFELQKVCEKDTCCYDIGLCSECETCRYIKVKRVR